MASTLPGQSWDRDRHSVGRCRRRLRPAVGGSSVAKKNGAPRAWVSVISSSTDTGQAMSPGPGGPLDADDHGASQILVMAQARKRTAGRR